MARLYLVHDLARASLTRDTSCQLRRDGSAHGRGAMLFATAVQPPPGSRGDSLACGDSRGRAAGGRDDGSCRSEWPRRRKGSAPLCTGTRVGDPGRQIARPSVGARSMGPVSAAGISAGASSHARLCGTESVCRSGSAVVPAAGICRRSAPGGALSRDGRTTCIATEACYPHQRVVALGGGEPAIRAPRSNGPHQPRPCRGGAGAPMIRRSRTGVANPLCASSTTGRANAQASEPSRKWSSASGKASRRSAGAFGFSCRRCHAARAPKRAAFGAGAPERDTAPRRRSGAACPARNAPRSRRTTRAGPRASGEHAVPHRPPRAQVPVFRQGGVLRRLPARRSATLRRRPEVTRVWDGTASSQDRWHFGAERPGGRCALESPAPTKDQRPMAPRARHQERRGGDLNPRTGSLRSTH